MARKPRIEFPGAFYHVIARGNNRQKIFLGEKDCRHFLKRLKLYKEKFDFVLYAYALMPNHIHLLLETSDVPLSQIMQPLQLSYTQYFNLAHDKVGHLFQGRYKAILCQKDTYLMELIRYIILNPVRAKLVKRPVNWPWSSYFEVAGQGDDCATSVRKVLGLFGERRGSAIKAFQRFINDGLSEGHKEEYYQLKDQRVLGNDDFAEEAIERESKDFEHYNVTIDDVIGLVANHTGIGVEEISSSCRGRRGARGRGIVAYIGKNMGGLTAKEISRYFKRSEVMMSKLINGVDVERGRNHDFDRLIAKLENSIKHNYRPLLVKQK